MIIPILKMRLSNLLKTRAGKWWIQDSDPGNLALTAEDDGTLIISSIRLGKNSPAFIASAHTAWQM